MSSQFSETNQERFVQTSTGNNFRASLPLQCVPQFQGFAKRSRHKLLFPYAHMRVFLGIDGGRVCIRPRFLVTSCAFTRLRYRLEEAQQYFAVDRMFVGLIRLSMLTALLAASFVYAGSKIVHRESAYVSSSGSPEDCLSLR